MIENDYTPEYSYTMQSLAYQFVKDYESISGLQLIEIASFFRMPMPHTNTKNAIINNIAVIKRNSCVHKRGISNDFITRVFSYANQFRAYMQDRMPDITTIPDKYLCAATFRDKQVILAERGGYALI